MGFKKISKDELVSSQAPAFLGAPLEHVEEIDLLKERRSDVEKQFGFAKSEVFVSNSENLKYEYSKNGTLINFIGTGSINVLNNSKKDRIWDVKLDYSSDDNLSLEKDKIINLGNFEPETNKKVNYQIKDSEDLVNPIKVFEKIKVMNIQTDDLGAKLKQKKLKKIEQEIQEKRETTKKKIKMSYGHKISSVEDKIHLKNNELDEALDKISKLSQKNKKLLNQAGLLKKEIDSLIEDKEKYKEKNISKYLNKNQFKEETETQLKNAKEKLEQITERIPEVKTEYSEKKAVNIENILNHYDPKIKKLRKEMENCIENNKKAKKKEEEWEEKQDKLKTELKEKKKEIKNLEKEKKKATKDIEDEAKINIVEKEFDVQINDKRTQFEEIEKKLDEAEKKADEESERQKDLEDKIDDLEDNIEDLEDKKKNELESQNNKIDNSKKDTIETLEEKLQNTKNLISHLEKIKDTYDARIKELKAQLKENQENLKNINTKSDEWQEKKENVESEINSLRAKIVELNEQKENKLNKKLEEISQKEKERKEKILEGYHEITGEFVRDNYFLLFNQENRLKYSIFIENTSEDLVEDLRIAKQFSEEFRDFKYDSSSVSDVEIQKGSLIFSINSLEPGKKAEIIVYTSISPKNRQMIGTGNIQLSYIYKNQIMSNLEIDHLRGYSHAMHAMQIKEKETEPNKWRCSLIFKNNSEIDMELKSILVLDKDKETKYLDIDFNSNGGKLLAPQEKFISEEWEVADENEPKFFRKLEYSITHSVKKNAVIDLRLQESVFEIIDIHLDKKLSESEIKSFEEAEIQSKITVKNIGTTPMKGIMVKDIIPADFAPPEDLTQFQISTSSGRDISDHVSIEVVPDNLDHSIPHDVKISLNLDNIKSKVLIDVDEFLKISYPFKAIKPNHKKTYQFPLEVTHYYPQEKRSPENFYYLNESLETEKLPKLDIAHKRRDLLIGKEIFPGRDVDEFAISIIINNNSNIEVNDIDINDTISKSFEIVSANTKYEIMESEIEGTDMISFTVESILPYQEREIRYYVKSKDGEIMDQEKLESYLLS
ncbi:MAG: hypothetical protein BAJALOKI3v1_20008 [Promethearchaeota archaeon]|nr:MAG: hypothetical protein BAJALOKI3v1_20008 [Candidatus Lokiarchaeota archaeon]